MRDPLLRVEDLRLHFRTYSGTVQALRGVDLELREGETVGLVGESGSGKTQTALALARLAPVPPGEYVGGRVMYNRKGEGEREGTRAWVDVLEMRERELLSLRGNDIAMIFQDPMTSLNPVLTVGDQITEAIVAHQEEGRILRAYDRWWLRRGRRTRRYRRAQRAAWPRAIATLKRIGVPGPEGVMDRYPHELSGGMRQRVMIAIAMSCDPDLLIADEPTTALDVTVQAQIMDLMLDLKRRTNASILLISHNLGVVAEMAERINVMYAGRVVEEGPSSAVFHAPKHPYTLGLLNCVPNVARPREEDLPVIPGTVPDLADPPPGCAFHPRCPFAVARCKTEMPELQRVGEQRVACHLYDPNETVPRALKERDASVYLPTAVPSASARGGVLPA